MSVKVITKEVSKYFARFFHAYADGITVKELDVEEVRKMLGTNKIIVTISKSSFNVRKSNDLVYFPKKQLLAILKETEKWVKKSIE